MMTRKILAISVAAFSLLAAKHASAQDYPDRPIKLVVAYAAGGPVDSSARMVAKNLAAQLGKPVIVENKTGAGGAIGADAVAKAAPDGYTLFFAASPTQVINPHVHKSLAYDPIKDFTPISLVAHYTNVLVVNNSVPAKNVAELVSYAKANPDKVSFGSAGKGGSNHLSGELLKKITGAPMLHVPYKGNSPAMTDLIGGQITFMFDITGTAMNYISSGKVRALAVTSSVRNSMLPDLPTMIEAGVPGFDVTGWYGLMGPARLPAAVTAKLNQAVKVALYDAALKQQLSVQGYDVIVSTPEEFAATIKKDYEFWGKVVRDAKIEKE
ncbi:MAG: Bug family tripartite tricarboxylate transporter substrate binding protein [Noviherbaspirillum sp.]